MFVVPNCQPAVELYGLLEEKLCTSAENLESSEAVEHRLQLLGIKNSTLILEKLGKLGKNEVVERKCSVRSWLWHQYLSRHGNCSLCERPLDGLHNVSEFQTFDTKIKSNDVVMLTCAHALHPECAEEMHQNRNGCQRCEIISQPELNRRKQNGREDRKKCLCWRWCMRRIHSLIKC
uniref:RING-type domain-containing protein n=1 Tax=Elaeophora elaphi TaxID=1147741 RepID=A0A0R3S405_9BILA